LSIYRPPDDQYWVPNWSSILFAGDLFAAIPFIEQPTLTVIDEGSGKHFLGVVNHGYGLLISPTCDMIDQKTGELSHAFRVLVPVVPLSLIAEQAPGQRQNISQIEARDTIHPYMYLPPLPLEGRDEPLVACLYRPTMVGDELLRNPPRRVVQLHPEARRQLKIKLARYWGRVNPDRDPIELLEVDEDRFRSDGPSVYDIEG
jgi:hypothetical protein